jgi:ATP-dependent protease ClpP protease subunit
MVEIKVYDDIANKNEKMPMEAFEVHGQVFSADAVRNIFSKNAKERDFRFNIHCNGGYVSEGLAIYDIIRTSGKNIYAHIDGDCHSMAVIILLAAPLKNRTANANASALIHRVRVSVGDDMTAEELSAATKLCVSEENNILRIYAERTGRSEAELRKLMNKEQKHSAQELLELGFISKIISYNTNKFKPIKKMAQTNTTKPATPAAGANNKPAAGANNKPAAANSKPLTLIQQATGLLGKIANALTPKEATNYDYTDEEGNVLFSTEAEEDTLAVGDSVTIPDGSTDGTFELSDGRTVTVEGGVVTEIEEAPGDDTENRLIALEAENTELRNLLTEAQNVIQGFKEHGGSNYVPHGRTVSPTAKKAAAPTKDDLKNAMLEKRKLVYGKKP